jgi:hypothetical protein
MGHYAFLDSQNIVTEVITGKDETEILDGLSPEEYYSNFRGKPCKRTSYNTFANTHMLGGVPFRKNYAGIGFQYDENRDAFIPPKPFESWILNESTCQWEPPIQKPGDGKFYFWNESNQNWDQAS